MKTVQEILDQIDPYDQAQLENFDAALAEARGSCPVLHSDAHGGFFYLTKYADVRAVCEQPELFSSRNPSAMGPLPIRMIPLDSDPPDHRLYRRVLNPYFSRSFLMRYADEVRAIAESLVDSFIDKGSFDVVEDYATPFSSEALARIVFVTSDHDLVQRAIRAVERTGAPDQTPQDSFNLAAVAQEAMKEAERDSSTRDDVLSALVTFESDGRKLTMEERLGIIITLLAGGLDTTKGALTGIVHHLATDPQLEHTMRERDWTRTMLDEFLRMSSTVAFMARTAVEDTVIGDTAIPAGSRVVLGFSSANRDEARFPQADEMDFDRHGNVHAAFGLGIHRCLGSNFARMQLEIAVNALLERLTNFRLTPGAPVERTMGQSFKITDLHVDFDRR